MEKNTLHSAGLDEYMWNDFSILLDSIQYWVGLLYVECGTVGSSKSPFIDPQGGAADLQQETLHRETTDIGLMHESRGHCGVPV